MSPVVSGIAAQETLLVVEANPEAAGRLQRALRAPDRLVYLAPTLAEAMGQVDMLKPDLVLVSLALPERPGFAAVDAVVARVGRVPVVATDETGSAESAVEALRHGAVDYLPLDATRTRLLELVQRAVAERRAARELQHAQQEVKDRYGFANLVSQSPRMTGVFDKIRAVAPTDATVLVLGETGTGKELVARAIHQRSKRRESPLIAVNCGAFAETLLESELFGHEKGSFTGAVGRREGLFEMADGGTLFLDELGETSLNVQVNLLRVLEEMSFRRVGGREPVQVDVRIVAATNVHLEEAVEAGEFREDLFYRLNVFPIRLPPLRERPEDIPLLMRHFLDEISQEYGMDAPAISGDAIGAILAYRWPGNVRQLRAMCERWVITHTGRRLEAHDLPSGMVKASAKAALEAPGISIDEGQSLKAHLDKLTAQLERAYLYRVLRSQAGHLGQTAEVAGITRRTLYSKMKLYGLEAEDFRREPG